MKYISLSFLFLMYTQIGLSQSKYTWALRLDYDYFEDVHNGQIKVKHQSKQGLIDTNGDIIVPIKYDFLSHLSENLVGAGFINTEKVNRQSGFINTENKFLIPQKFERANTMHENRAAVLYRGLWGYINNNGKWLLFPKFQEAGIFKNGHAIVKANDKWGIIKRDGEFIVDNDYLELRPISEDLIAVNLNGKWGFVDTLNEFIIPTTYEYALSFSDKIAVVAKQQKYGAINHEGKTIIPFTYEDMRSFTYGLAPAKQNGKWGIINLENQWVVPPTYQEAYQYANGVSRIKLDGKYGFIDTKGDLVISNIFTEAHDFKERLARVYTEDEKGFIRYIPKETEIDQPLADANKVTTRRIKSGTTIKVNNPNLTILASDHKKIDNDIVSINFQGKWVVKDQTMAKHPYSFDIQLKKGKTFTKKNFLMLYAMNLGRNPPNTAKITIIDGDERKEVILESDLETCDIIYFEYE